MTSKIGIGKMIPGFELAFPKMKKGEVSDTVFFPRMRIGLDKTIWTPEIARIPKNAPIRYRISIEDWKMVEDEEPVEEEPQGGRGGRGGGMQGGRGGSMQ